MNPKKLIPCFLVFGLVSVAAAQNANQNYLTDPQLMQMAGDQYASGELPLGDQHYVLDAPRKGYIYLCRKYGDGAGGAQHAGNWIHGDTWNWRKKISVQGAVNWSNAEFSITREGDQRILSGNGLPIDHTTGIFPIQPNDPASAFDRNPNSIRVQTMQETLPADPAYTDPPFCMGMEAGIMLDGVPLFNGFDAGLRDAAAHEVQDACQGHPQVSGQYHYHSLSSCIRDASEKTVIGYALDGFPITGPYVALGKYLTTGDLDECHGLTSEIIQDGQKKITYHYVMTIDFPYSVSCFRARPVRTGPPQSERGGMMQRNGGMNGGGMPMQSGPMQMPGGNGQSMPHRPPPEALDACSGRSDGDACAFIAPRGDQISGACHAPSGNGLACIPMR